MDYYHITLTIYHNSLFRWVQLLEEGQTKDLTLLVGQKMDEGASSEEVKELKNQLIVHLNEYI